MALEREDRVPRSDLDPSKKSERLKSVEEHQRDLEEFFAREEDSGAFSVSEAKDWAEIANNAASAVNNIAS